MVGLCCFALTYFQVMLSMSGILGILISFATANQIKYTSPLTHNVSATAKAAAQTAIALLLFRNPITGLGLASIGIVLLGSMSYSIVRRREMLQKASQERLPEKA